MKTEIVSKRDKYSKTYKLDNGQYEREIFSYPIHFINSNQLWEDIDLKIDSINMWEFTNGVLKNNYRTYFYDSTSNNKHLVSVEILDEYGNEKWVNYKLKNADPTSTLSDGERFIFYNCFENIDVEYIVVNDMLKENIIFNSKSSIREFTFSLKFDGVKIEIDEQNNVSFKDNTNERVLMIIDKPFMIDKNGVESYNVVYSIGHNGEYDTLIVTINDEEYMENATYPVILDPTIIVDDGSQDVIMPVYMTESSGSNPSGWTYNTSTYFGGWHFGYAQNVSAIYFNALNDLKKDMEKNEVIINKAVFSICVYRGTPRWNTQGFKVSNVAQPMKIGTPPVSSNDSFFIGGTYSIGSWVNINFADQLRIKGKDFNGFYFTPNGTYLGTGFYSPFYSDITKRPKLVLQYFMKPVLGFHDGTAENGGYYADPQQNIFKYLNLGTLIAGQTSIAQKIYLKNLSGFAVKNLKIFVSNSDLSNDVKIEISKTQNPFVVEPELIFTNGAINDGDDVVFYLRVVTGENAISGGNIKISANAEPV